MGTYILRRVLLIIPTVLLISILTFFVIELPPGDYVTSRMMELEMQGTPGTAAQREAMTRQYALDRPGYERYFKWMGGLLRGDLGMSFMFNRPVEELIGERILLTMTIVMTVLCAALGCYWARGIGTTRTAPPSSATRSGSPTTA